MRGHVLQPWMAASLLITASLTVGVATTSRVSTRSEPGRWMTPVALPVEHCAAPAPRRSANIVPAASPREAATMVLALMVERARRTGIAR